MVLLAQQGSDDHFHAEYPCKSQQSRSTSCGGRQRSMGRRCQVQQRCGDSGARAHSSSHLRHRGPPSSGARPAEEVQLREPSATEDAKVIDDFMQETTTEQEDLQQGLNLVCGMLVNWVDSVADDLVDEDVIQQMPYEELEFELWDTISDGSCEDWDDASSQLSDYAPPADMYLLEPQVFELPAPLAPPREPLTSNLLNLMKQAVASMPAKKQPPLPMSPAKEVDVVVEPQVGQVSVETTLMASPLPGPSSRSSTPSRSVRHHRRVIGGVVRPVASPDAAAPSPPLEAYAPVQMNRAVSTSALAMDLGLGASPDVCSRTTTPASCDRVSRHVKFCVAPGGEVQVQVTGKKFKKSKSMGALHAMSSSQGLGLSSPMLSMTSPSKHAGLLPSLGADRQSSSAELVAWSRSMTKRGGLRLVF